MMIDTHELKKRDLYLKKIIAFLLAFLLCQGGNGKASYAKAQKKQADQKPFAHTLLTPLSFFCLKV